MNITCPTCASPFELMAGIEDADGRRWCALICELPQNVIKPLIGYLRLFKPDKQGLRWSRMLKLTQELAPMIKNAEIKFNHNTYTAPAELWATMMIALVDTPPATLRLPLKTNGYLFSMIAGSAEKDAATTESKKIEKARSRPRAQTAVVTSGGMQHVANRMPEGWLENTKNKMGRGDDDGERSGRTKDGDSGQDRTTSGAE